MDGKMIFDLCLVIFNDYYSINQNVRLLLTMLYPMVMGYISKSSFKFFRQQKEYIIYSDMECLKDYVNAYINKNVYKFDKIAVKQLNQMNVYTFKSEIVYDIEDCGYKFSFTHC